MAIIPTAVIASFEGSDGSVVALIQVGWKTAVITIFGPHLVSGKPSALGYPSLERAREDYDKLIEHLPGPVIGFSGEWIKEDG